MLFYQFLDHHTMLQQRRGRFGHRLARPAQPLSGNPVRQRVYPGVPALHRRHRRHEVTSADEAFAYLKGEPLRAAGLRGWTAVTWQGYPLGWGKASEGVIKNHYPKGLRIMKK